MSLCNIIRHCFPPPVVIDKIECSVHLLRSPWIITLKYLFQILNIYIWFLISISDSWYLFQILNIYFRFYSCAIQYHESGSQPMGLVLCSNSSLLVIIKKETSSFVRPLDTLEHLVLHDRSASMGPELFQVSMFKS